MRPVWTIILTLTILCCCTSLGAQDFLRGDVNGDGQVVPMSDALHLLNYVFADGSVPPCMEAADVDDNGVMAGLVDTVRLLAWAYADAEAPPTPGPEVCGPDADEDLGCEAEQCEVEVEDPEADADVVLSVDSAVVDDAGEESVTITVNLDNDGDDSLKAVQFGVCHDPDIVCVAATGVVESGVLEDARPTFNFMTVEDGRWSAGLMFSVTDDELESGESRDLYVVAYTIMGEGTSDLTFCEFSGENGDQPVRAFTVDGTALLPTVEDGSIEVTAFDGEADCIAEPPDQPGGGEPEFGEYTFVIGDGTAISGGDVTLPLGLEVVGASVVAWQFGACYDSELLEYLDGEVGDDFEDVGVLFASFQSNEVGNVAIAGLVSIGEVLEERDAIYEIGNLTFSTLDDFDSTEISVCDLETTVGTHEPGIIQEGGNLDDAEYDDGTVFMSSGFVSIIPNVIFERGDANGNGVVDALTDGIFIMKYAFQEGDMPPCMDAADTNNNGEVDGITDGLRLFRWGFSEGPAPADPFGECDTDPAFDTDSLGCSNLSDACL